MSQLLASVIASVVSAIGAIAAAFISYLNRKSIQSQTTTNNKSGNPT